MNGDEGRLIQHRLPWVLATAGLLRFESEQVCSNNIILFYFLEPYHPPPKEESAPPDPSIQSR